MRRIILLIVVGIGLAACGASHDETCARHGGIMRVNQKDGDNPVVVICRDGYLHQWGN